MRFPTLCAAALAALMPVLAAAAPVLAQATQPGQATQPAEKQARPEAQQIPAPTAPPQPGGAPQAGTVKGNHGAWSILCDKPAGATTDQCALMQNVIAEDRPEVGLSVVVLKTADRKARILRILAPLGVLLKDGMDLFVDGNNIGRAYFTRCFSEGCYVEVEIDEELMKILRAGKRAVFALRESVDQDRVGIPIELAGFATGYDALP